ncbi:Putative glycosyl transferase, family 1, ALG11 mannosyltransferase [Septoria linicola]|uniref:GDP-Man:Man(3)GlcNAc(2)-PP-Dol alpha-1,2-mannosyltransferase n=1 Tax=Septoria linicola TaxID=215465 RepID=A0A9Q9AYK3_9PEZI|nr:Putative glycosyl transferase, family 1, ALG11 mannosyltransferase [Septoria linicola]
MVVITLLSIVLGLVVLGSLLPFGVYQIGRLIGLLVTSKTQHRREILIERAERENGEREHKDAGKKTTASSSTSLSSEWDKVTDDDDREKTPVPATATSSDSNYNGVIGFFHPFCNAGGGGERVLFAAILATQRTYPNALCVVYTGDNDATREQILANVRDRFDINLNPARVVFLYLQTRDWVLASRWPHFTLLGQSVGSLILGWDAFTLLVPDIFVDTMGYGFVIALCRFLFPKVPTGAYVHYPTISTDMLRSLHNTTGTQGLNAGQGSGLKGRAKQTYWEWFASLYRWVGGNVDVVMTNSTWTQNHISELWGKARTKQRMKHQIQVVYPPCPVEELQKSIPVDQASEKSRKPDLLYIAQFRQEKKHEDIIKAFHIFLKEHHSNTPLEKRPKLVLVGSVRNDTDDEKKVYKLRLQAQEVKDSVEFIVNAKYSQVVEYLKSSSVGVNGMWNEHFGIGVVEYQAAGLIAVVNNSGGPKEDIVIEIDGKPTGFHASTPEEFASGFHKALSLAPEEAFAMRLRARKSSLRFSEQVFAEAWLGQLACLVALQSPSR